MKSSAILALAIVTATHAAEPQGVWTYWNDGNKDHSAHFPPAWGGEHTGDQSPAFYAWPSQVPGSKAFHCFWNGHNLDHDCHPGGPYEGEDSTDSVAFWAMSDDGPFREPLYLCWHGGNRDHTIHPSPAWPGEDCDWTTVQGYAYASWPTKIVYSLHPVFEFAGGSTGWVEKTMEWSSGITNHDSHSEEVSTKLAAALHAEAGMDMGIFSDKVSADVSTEIDTSIQSTWEETRTFSKSEKQTISVDMSKPAYIYTAKIEMYFSDGVVTAQSDTLIQVTSPVDGLSVTKEVHPFDQQTVEAFAEVNTNVEVKKISKLEVNVNATVGCDCGYKCHKNPDCCQECGHVGEVCRQEVCSNDPICYCDEEAFGSNLKVKEVSKLEVNVNATVGCDCGYKCHMNPDCCQECGHVGEVCRQEVCSNAPICYCDEEAFTSNFEAKANVEVKEVKEISKLEVNVNATVGCDCGYKCHKNPDCCQECGHVGEVCRQEVCSNDPICYCDEEAFGSNLKVKEVSKLEVNVNATVGCDCGYKCHMNPDCCQECGHVGEVCRQEVCSNAPICYCDEEAFASNFEVFV